jgi:predicted aconitase with swiveling domain
MVNPADSLAADRGVGGAASGTGMRLTSGAASGDLIFLEDGLSFWGGVDPDSGTIIDTHHPACGQSVTGKVVAMPTSRGSCSGSGVLLELALNGLAPAALIFGEAEEILTLGALVAGQVFGQPVPVLCLPPDLFGNLSTATHAVIDDGGLSIDGTATRLEDADLSAMELTARDQSMLDGVDGPVTAMAMDIICRLAVMQGAGRTGRCDARPYRRLHPCP